MKQATIRMKSEDVAEVLIYDEIGDESWGGISAKGLTKQLKDLKAKTINVRINSPGGSVFDGFSIYEALKRHPARIEVDIDGYAASIASVIAMAGEKIRMSKFGFFMIHNPSGFSMGESKDLRKTADLLDQVKEKLLIAYMERTDASKEEIDQWMNNETWFGADQAKNIGFIDSVTDHALAACAMPSKVSFRNMPDELKGPTAEQLAAHEQRKEKLAKILGK